MPNWSEIKFEQRQEILGKMGQIPKDEGMDSCVTFKSLDQFVGNLSAGEMQEQCFLIVEGKLDTSKKAAIEPLKTKLKEAAGDVEIRFEMSCSIAQGDSMGVIEGVNKVMEDGTTTVTHEAGQVLLLDFWATWCPPCQAPMQHNQEMLEKRGSDWGNKVRLIGLSIDNDAATVKNHVNTKGWNKVEHYHVRTEGCTADKDYGVQGVPHVLLVDTTGKIVFVGHPSSRKLEEDIDALLRGEKITGAGTTRAGGDEDEEGGSSTISQAKYTELTDKFKSGTTALVADADVKAAAGKLQRAFLVLVVDAKWDIAQNEMTGSMQCITQLFGNDQEAKNSIQAKTKPITETEGWTNRKMIR